MCSGFLFCLWSGQSEFVALFVVFNFQIGSGFIFETCSKFVIFNSHFPVTTLQLDLFSGAYLNMLLFLWCAVMENSLI